MTVMKPPGLRNPQTPTISGIAGHRVLECPVFSKPDNARQHCYAAQNKTVFRFTVSEFAKPKCSLALMG